MNKVSQNLKTLMKSTREKYKKVNFYYQKEDKRNKNARRYMEIIGRKLNLEAIRYRKHVLKLKQNWQELDEEYRQTQKEWKKNRRRRRTISSDDDEEDGERTKRRKMDDNANSSATKTTGNRRELIGDEDNEGSSTRRTSTTSEKRDFNH